MTGWPNASFCSYADYKEASEFFAGLKTLKKIIKDKTQVAIM
jgi:hypothetical protein